MIKVTNRGSFQHMELFSQRVKQKAYLLPLAKYGPIGVAALRAATPFGEGATAAGWYYEIVERQGYFAIHWLNSHTEEPGTIPIAVLIQYGHATRSGGYVQGREYINSAIQPVFDQIAADMWKEVTI